MYLVVVIVVVVVVTGTIAETDGRCDGVDDDVLAIAIELVFHLVLASLPIIARFFVKLLVSTLILWGIEDSYSVLSQ